MRTKSLEYEDLYRGEDPLTPTTHYLPNSRAGLFPGNNLFHDGQSPDERMRAYAAMSRDRAAASNENGNGFSSLIGTVKKFGMGLWRK